MTTLRLRCLAWALVLCASGSVAVAQAPVDLRTAWRQTPSRTIRADGPLSQRLDQVLGSQRGVEVEAKRVNWHYFILGEIRRGECMFILDTGAAGVSVDGRLAGALGLPVEVIEGRRFTRSTINVGGEEYGPAPLRWIAPLAGRRSGFYGLNPQPGLLGLVPLRQLGGVLDVARSKFWISPRRPKALGDALAADEWGRQHTAVPLLSSENRLRWFVPVVINDVRGFMLLDTGLGSTTLLRSAADRASVAYREEADPQHRRVDAQGNVVDVRRGSARSFYLGSVRVPRGLLEVGEPPSVLKTLQDGTPPEWGVPFGLLGNDTLDQLEAIIDCGGERLFLRKR